MGLGLDSQRGSGDSGRSLNLPGPQFPLLEKRVNYPCLSISQDGKNKMIESVAWLCSVLSMILLNAVATRRESCSCRCTHFADEEKPVTLESFSDLLGLHGGDSD